MKLQFDKNQQYQLDAIQAVIDLFEGQDLNTSDFEFSLSDNAAGSLQFSEAGVGNRFTIAPEQILTNLHKIQYKNGVEKSEELESLFYKDENGEKVSTEFGNYSIEMETGTGKTYVYIRSIYELHNSGQSEQ